MAQNRRTAPAAIRRLIHSCLTDSRYRIYPDGQRFLDHKNLNAGSVVEDLIADITKFEIFVLPQQQPGVRRKYDYVIRYDEGELLVYTKMTPTDDPPFVFLTFHAHNIPGPPLPQIPITKPSDE